MVTDFVHGFTFNVNEYRQRLSYVFEKKLNLTMGLLTDAKRMHKLGKIISQYNNALSIVCYFVGLAGFLALAYAPFNAATYFSENALLPGLVTSDFFSNEAITSFSEDLRRELQANKRETPKKWLFGKFQNIGLDVYTQNFSINYPLNLLPPGQTVDGQNIYAILRAPRAASTEAIVVSAPFRPLSNPHPKTHAGIALMLTLAKHFYKQSYWAKDIIFVITDQEYVGMQAWLDAYHGTTKSPHIIADDLFGRSGAIQAAINLEIGTTFLTHVNINIEGLNGQLPNLDMVNLVTKLSRMEGFRPLLHRRSDHRDPESLRGYAHSLVTMVTMMWHQATGSPSGNHGLFHQYNIEAVTLEGIKRTGNSREIADMGRVVEGCLRSLNNLLERFHQSFFFYLLPATQRYVSIGLYMIPFGVMVAALLIKAIAMWIESKKYSKTEEPQVCDNTDEATVKPPNTDTDKEEQEPGVTNDEHRDTVESDITEQDDPFDVDSFDTDQSVITQLLPVIILSSLMGLVLYISPSYFASASRSFKMGVDDSLVFGLLAVFVASLSLASVLAKLSDEGTVIQWETLKCLSLIIQSLVLFSCALINISLAFFLAAFNILPALIVRPVRKKFLRWIQLIFILLTSPPALLLYASIANTLITAKSTPDLDVLAASTLFTFKRSIFLAVLDAHLIGNWTYAMFCFAVIPSWLMVWSIARIVP